MDNSLKGSHSTIAASSEFRDQGSQSSVSGKLYRPACNAVLVTPSLIGLRHRAY